MALWEQFVERAVVLGPNIVVYYGRWCSGAVSVVLWATAAFYRVVCAVTARSHFIVLL